MRYLVASIFVFLMSINQSSAQRIQFFGNFNTLDVIAFAQCELGVWAKKVHLPLPTGRDKALVSAEGTETITVNAGAKGNWFVYGEAAYKSDVTQIAQVSRPRNIHPDNDEACRKNRPPLGILQCLSLNAKNYPNDDIKCTTKVSATASATLGAKFNVWVVGAEATGTLASTRSYNIVVTLPKPGG